MRARNLCCAVRARVRWPRVAWWHQDGEVACTGAVCKTIDGCGVDENEEEGVDAYAEGEKEEQRGPGVIVSRLP